MFLGPKVDKIDLPETNDPEIEAGVLCTVSGTFNQSKPQHTTRIFM